MMPNVGENGHEIVARLKRDRSQHSKVVLCSGRSAILLHSNLYLFIYRYVLIISLSPFFGQRDDRAPFQESLARNIISVILSLIYFS